MKIKSKKFLKRQADKEWADNVKIAWNHKCAVCGSYNNLNSHHLISRVYLLTRYDLSNGIALCAKHHQFSKVCSPHSGSLGFVMWLDINHHNLIVYLANKLNEISKGIV